MKTSPFISQMIELRMWFKDYKSTIVCENCKATTGIEFHHIGEKKMKVSSLVRVAHSKEEILEEIKKCKPLCNACHKKEHRCG